jgi:hypothetical protein
MTVDPTAHMCAVLTLLLHDESSAAAQYICALSDTEAKALAATCCANVIELIHDTAREERVDPEELLQAIALRAARMAAA